MAVGTQSENAITFGTTVALQIKAGGKAAEITMDVSVTPESIMAAAGTDARTFPLIIFLHLKNILEQSGNKIYHHEYIVEGAKPLEVNGRGVLQNSPPDLFIK